MLYAPIILDQSIFIYCIIILQKIIYLFFTFLLWTLKIQDKMNDCLDTNFTLIDLKRINKLYIQEIFDYFEQLFLRKNKIALLIQCIQYCILLRLLLSLCFSLIFFIFFSHENESSYFICVLLNRMDSIRGTFHAQNITV